MQDIPIYQCSQDSLLEEKQALNDQLNAYKLMFLYENTLRELIIDSLFIAYGNKWRKQGIPSDVRAKIKDSVASEKSLPKESLVFLDPLYYSDFADLQKIINNTNNWEHSFKTYFTQKQFMDYVFSELLPIRNSIAHNRKISSASMLKLHVNYQNLFDRLGSQLITKLQKITLLADDYKELMDSLKLECKNVANLYLAHDDIPPCLVWEKADERGFIDEVFMGCNVGCFYDFFRVLSDYQKIPKIRGYGGRREKFVRENHIGDMLQKIEASIEGGGAYVV